MQVYKLFFQIMRSKRPIIILYVCVFIFFTIINANSLKESNDKILSTNLKTAIFDSDRSSLSNAVTQYIEGKAKIVEIKDDAKIIKDALFYNKIDYVIYIPDNFEESILAKNTLKLTVTASPDTTSSQLMDMMLDAYIQTATVYANGIDNISVSELITLVEKDLNQQTNTSFSSQQKGKDDSIRFLFNFSAYSVIAITIYIFGAFILSMNKIDIVQRINSSSITQKNVFTQVLLAAFIFALCLWTIFNIVVAIYCGSAMFNTTSLLMSLNLFIIILVFLSLSYLLGILIKDGRIKDMVANTLALGLSFASGVFVPLEILGDTIKSVASFTPTYWYVKANDTLSSMSKVNMSTLKPIFQSYLIELGFLMTILACILVVMNIKRKRPA